MILSRWLAIAGLLSVGGCAASSGQTDAENMSNTSNGAGNATPVPPVTFSTVKPEHLVVRLPRVVAADMGAITAEPYLAFFEMGALVRHYKTARQLRVTYYQGAFGGSSIETDLYDRRKHTLKVFCFDGSEVGYGNTNTLYVGVTDAVLLKLTAPGAAKQLGKPSYQAVDYVDITQFGAVLKSSKNNFHATP